MFDDFMSLTRRYTEALKEYSVLFPSKLNTYEFIFCAMKQGPSQACVIAL